MIEKIIQMTRDHRNAVKQRDPRQSTMFSAMFSSLCLGLYPSVPGEGRRLRGEGDVRDEGLGLADHLRGARSQAKGERCGRLLETDLARAFAFAAEGLDGLVW